MEEIPYLYICKNKICMTMTPCREGRELKEPPQATQESREVLPNPFDEASIDEYFKRTGGGMYRIFEPGEFTMCVKFKDGTEKTYHKPLEFVKGCERK